MVGVGAGAPAPPLLVRATPPSVGSVLPPLRRRRRRLLTAAAAAASKQKQQQQQRRRRRWWSDEEEEEEGEEYEDFFFPGSSSSSSSRGFGGELFDEPWFSKAGSRPVPCDLLQMKFVLPSWLFLEKKINDEQVFKTFGFLLPLMLASMLVATGPRAFLMAMAIPLAQSAVSFLLDAIWGTNNGDRRGQQPFYPDEDEDEDFPEFAGGGDRGRRRQSNQQSWVPSDDASSAAARESGGRGFGGWDELLGSSTRQRQAAAPSTQDDEEELAPSISRSRRRRGRMSSSTTKYKYKQAPLLMRLLVAVFPFLGSWFRLL
jgi:hypothetical protein